MHTWKSRMLLQLKRRFLLYKTSYKICSQTVLGGEKDLNCGSLLLSPLILSSAQRQVQEEYDRYRKLPSGGFLQPWHIIYMGPFHINEILKGFPSNDCHSSLLIHRAAPPQIISRSYILRPPVNIQNPKYTVVPLTCIAVIKFNLQIKPKTFN